MSDPNAPTRPPEDERAEPGAAPEPDEASADSELVEDAIEKEEAHTSTKRNGPS